MSANASPAGQTACRVWIVFSIGMDPGENSGHVPIKQELNDEERAMQAESRRPSTVKQNPLCLPNNQRMNPDRIYRVYKGFIGFVSF